MPSLLRALFAKSSPVPVPAAADWAAAFDLPVFAGLTGAEFGRLRELALRLVADKGISPVAGATPTGAAIAAIAAQAALPILNLGYGWYAGWNELIVYPQQFVPEREVTDDYGVVHRVRQPLSGEAWEGGPLILSLDDVAASGWRDGYNVVIHEFAHKLDMKNGAVDGLPPLHSGMSAADWAAAFESAYTDLCRRVDAGRDTEIDPYATDSPAEFFAVLSEYFFELPDLLARAYPAVYAQMSRFYRQDPLARLEHAPHDPAAP